MLAGGLLSLACACRITSYNVCYTKLLRWNLISYVFSKERSIGNWVVQLIEDYTSVDELDYVMQDIRNNFV